MPDWDYIFRTTGLQTFAWVERKREREPDSSDEPLFDDGVHAG